jgi:hypothetical protein
LFSGFAGILAASAVASWFETREDALLAMRVWDLILRFWLKKHPAFSGSF